MQLRKVFGVPGSTTQKANDPFLLIRSMPQDELPFIFLACGDHEVLQGTTQRFAAIVQERNIASEFDTFHGGHNWETWNQALPALERDLLKTFELPVTDAH